MNKHFNIVDETNTNVNSSAINPDRFVDAPPVMETLIQDRPLGETIVTDGTLNKAFFHKVLINDGIPYFVPMAEVLDQQMLGGAEVESLATLLNHQDSEHLRTRWNEIQGRFVDEPRSAVQQADVLVSEVIDRITEMFANERGLLEGQWKQGEDVSTEDLRQALQHYRSFFNRLVS